MGLADRVRKKAKDQDEPRESKALTQYDLVEVYLRSKWDFRYNVVLSREEFKSRGAKNWEQLTDREANAMLRAMRHTGIKCSKTLLDETISSDFSNPYDPFNLYFSSLPSHNPSNPSVIKALSQTISLEDEAERPRFEMMLKKWLVGTVANATTDGAINELILIFIGRQGDGKTRWFRKLIPEQLSEYQFTGMINTSDKDSKVLLCECFLINLDEMATLRKNDIEGVKSFLSEDRVRVRRSYAKRAETLVRRASFCGSDNDGNIIADPTGSRRFLIFKVNGINYNHTVDIDKVYAEAMYLYNNGESYWLDASEIESLNKYNEEFAVITAEEDLVAKYFEPGDDFYTATDIIREINFEEAKHGRNINLTTNQATLKKIGGACKKLGITKKAKKINGVARYGYFCKMVQSSEVQQDNTATPPF